MAPKKASTKKNPMSSFRNLYLYLVCGITIVMILIASIMVVQVALDTYVFKIDTPRYGSMCDEPKMVGEAEMTEEEIAECEANEAERLSNERKRDVSEALAMLLVAFPLYWFHWRTIQKDHKH